MSCKGPSHTWLCAGASVCGLVHELAGRGCEDAWAVEAWPPEVPEVLAVAVSDGAGSARFGQLGAALSVRWASRILAQEFDHFSHSDAHEASQRLFVRLRRVLRHRARKAGQDLREFACTLIALAVKRDGQWMGFHIGDGAVVAQGDDQLVLLSAPQKGEFVNETFFVTDDDFARHFRVLRPQPATAAFFPTAFALFTDGLESQLINDKEDKVAPVFAKLFHWVRTFPKDVVERALYENLRDVLRPRSSTGDDCTLVLLARRAQDGA